MCECNGIANFRHFPQKIEQLPPILFLHLAELEEFAVSQEGERRCSGERENAINGALDGGGGGEGGSQTWFH